MTIHILSDYETKKIEKQLQEQFGIKKLNGKLIKIGQDRIFLFQGLFTNNQLNNLASWVPVERIGVYFAKEQNNEIRLSIEGTHLLKEQIKENIFELNEEQLDSWMHGNELNVESGKNTFLVMKYKEDLVGTGKASKEKITNFVPKSRRLRERNNG